MITERAIRVFGAATGRGAGDVGCQSGPGALRRSGLVAHLAQAGCDVRWEATFTATEHGAALSAVHDLSARLSRRVRSTIARGAFPLVVGGDHSCAIGTWNGVAAALRPRGPLGLIWIDAHMDGHVPETSPTGNLHGMPVAALLGHGDSALASVAGGPALRPEHVALVGVRSYEAGEAELLARLGVRVFLMDEVNRRGIQRVLREAHAIATRGTAAFGVSIDLDAFDPQDAPGVGTPVAGGIRARRLLPDLARLGAHPGLVALEIAEYNPHHDIGGRSAELVAQMAVAMLAPAPAPEHADRLVWGELTAA